MTIDMLYALATILIVVMTISTAIDIRIKRLRLKEMTKGKKTTHTRTLKEGTVGEIPEELAGMMDEFNRLEGVVNSTLEQVVWQINHNKMGIATDRAGLWKDIGHRLGFTPFEEPFSYTRHKGKALIIRGHHSEYPELRHKEEVSKDGR